MTPLLKKLLKFRSDRNWKQYHTPQNIAQSIVLESTEILEIFQWKKTGEPLTEQEKANLADEMADVYNWLVLLSHDLGIDLEAAALEKVDKNAKKYPVTKTKGKAIKYTKL